MGRQQPVASAAGGPESTAKYAEAKWTDGALKKAADALLGAHSASLTTLYLQVFNMQREGGWQALTDLLASDERLQLG